MDNISSFKGIAFVHSEDNGRDVSLSNTLTGMFNIDGLTIDGLTYIADYLDEEWVVF